jgi:N-acetylglutamate synthase-like GNAT family acetyltransferase
MRTCSLLRGIRVERATRDDWLALAPLHYRSHHAGAITDVFRMVYASPLASRDREVAGTRGLTPAARLTCLVGVIVYSRSPLSLSARDRATGGRYGTAGLGRVAIAHLINEELRIISRVVIAPNWRGLGLAARLVAETMPQVRTPYVEALAAMGQMHPLFVRAGMTAYPQPPAEEGERLRAALEAAGISRTDRRSADALERILAALAPDARDLAERELARWARSYLAAKNHKTNRPDRRRILELAARHLDSSPVYYLWRRPEKTRSAELGARSAEQPPALAGAQQ